jgi:hypothetical protein
VASIRSIDTSPKERPFTSRLLVIVIFMLLSAAFAFIGLALTGRLAKNSAVTPQIAKTPEVVTPATPVAATPVATSQPAPASAPKPTSAAAPAVAAAPPTPLVLPESLHLQGVAYDPVRPWAIVSGKTVHVGDLIKGVHVVAISPNSVTFGSNGQTKMLYVGE